MNYDKSIVYDERPGFESYNMMNMSYPNMPMMPNMGFMQNNPNMNSYNQLESRVSTLEKKVKNLENNIKRLQSNIYPQATDYDQYSATDYSSYQNSMNIM